MQETLSSTVAKISSAISSLYNSFLGQTRSQARLNAIASYDQSNELFKVNLSRVSPTPRFILTSTPRLSLAAR
jgi:cyclopropane-fatty-acyl-phospholipid synthase